MGGDSHRQSDHKQAWALRAYAQSIMALAEARTTGEMVRRVCKTITDETPYVLAFIGLAEDSPGKPVKIANGTGAALAYMDDLTLSWSEDRPEGQGPTGRAIRSGKTYIMRDSGIDPAFNTWREKAARYGIKSSVTVPFRRGQHNDGVLMVYATEVDAFSAGDVELFANLGGAIGFAFSAFENQALREIERLRLQRLIESAHEPILFIDAAGKINYFNAAAEQAFGYTAAEILGHSPDRLIPQDASKIHANYVKQFLTDAGSPARQMAGGREVMALRKNGEQFPVEVTITRVDVGETHYAMAIIRDLTERKAFELRLLQSAKMEALGQLAGGMAHDFNNLLSVVLHNVELLEDYFKAGSDEAAMLDRVMRAVGRGTDLISRMMRFSRMQQTPASRIDIKSALENIASILRPTLGRQITINVQCPSGAEILADPAMFETSLFNLAINARDAMQTGGSLEFIVTQRSPASSADTPMIELEVRDSGSGIPAEVRERIFEPFYTTKTTGKGTGLGLATVKNFVESAHGHIRVDSVLGKGTSFFLSFPAQT